MNARGRIIIEADATPVMHAIERARLRLIAMPNRNPKEVVDYASAVIDEMGKIVDAKMAYDAQVAAAQAERAIEPEEFHSPKPTVLQ